MSTSRHQISLEAAKKLTRNYREKKKKILREEFGNTNTLCVSETFDRDIFDAILAQESCVGVRFYFAMNDAGEVGLTFVGVNDQDEDILPQSSGEVMMRTDDAVPVGGGGTRCPTECPPPSGLYP